MITSTVRIEYKDGDAIHIKPIADVHIGNTACDIRAFKQFLANSDDKTYFVGIGDLYDGINVKDKRYRKITDASISDAVIDEQVNKGIKILEPYKDRILGLGLGNHEDTMLKYGTDMIDRTCESLGVKHLGYSGLLKLILRTKTGRGRTVVIRYHHGWGGSSRTLGGDITKYARELIYWDADIYLFGHNHKKSTEEVARLGMAGMKLISKPIIICLCGTFQKTYIPGVVPPFAEKSGFAPISIGGVRIKIRPDKSWVKLDARLDSGYE